MKIYKITYVNQETGAVCSAYALADTASKIEEEYADIISIEPHEAEDFRSPTTTN